MGRSLLLVLFAAGGSACVSPSEGSLCEGAPEVTVLTSFTGVVSSDILVRGTARHSGNGTIRELLVAGVPAQNEGVNFDAWSVTLPITKLAALPPAGDSGDLVDVEITAIAACGSLPKTSFPIRVDRDPRAQVNRLAVIVAFPGKQSYLPADESGTAVLTVKANPEAVGARVTVTAPSGATVGDAGTTLTLTLAGDGSSDASATTTLSAHQPGTLLVTATAKTQTATTLVESVGAPRLFPSSGTLKPGQSLHVDVVQDKGGKITCQASPSSSLTASTSAGVNLAVTPQAVEGFDVVAASTLSEKQTLSVTCRDPFGQSSVGTYQGEP